MSQRKWSYRSYRSYRSWLAAVGLAAGGALLARPALADTYWQLAAGTPGLFDQVSNWTLGLPGTGVSGSGYITNGGTAQLLYPESFTFGTLTLSGGSSMVQTSGTISTQLNVQDSTYTLSGTGKLSLTGDLWGAPLGAGGVITSVFNLNGGTLSGGNLLLGRSSTQVSLLAITGGTLTNEIYGNFGGSTGYITQQGGTVNTGFIYLGNSDSANTGQSYYTLSGTGVLDATMFVMNAHTAVFAESGGSATITSFTASTAGSSLNLSGGSFTASNFTLNAGTTSTYTGGSLSILQTASVAGKLDFQNSAAQLALAANGYYDFSAGTLASTGNASLIAGAGALVIFPQGFNPATAFAQYNNQGITHYAGTPLVIPAAQQLIMKSTVSFQDPYDVYGALLPDTTGALSIGHGLTVRAGGQVILGTGNVNASTADTYLIQGGSLAANGIYVSNASQTASAVMTQTGGAVTANTLSMGGTGQIGGIYALQGGQLSATTVTVGNAGKLEQSGGTAQYSTVSVQGSNDYFDLSGGTAIIGKSLTVSSNGIFDFGNGTGVLEILNGATANLSGSLITNSFFASILVGQGATITFPASFNPLTELASYQTGVALPAPTPAPIVVGTGQTLQVATVMAHLDVAGTVTPLPGQTAEITQGVTVHDGGSVTVNGQIIVNDSISGISSGQINAPSMDIGSSAAGSFTQSGGAVTIAGHNMFVGDKFSGMYTMTGGTLTNTSGLEIGQESVSGSFIQSGGVHQITGGITINDGSDGDGTLPSSYQISGTGELDAGSMVIQYAGSFTQASGTVSFNSTNPNTAALWIRANDPANTAGYQISSGTLTSASVGIDSGQFNHIGGQVSISGNLAIGTAIEGIGTYTLSGGSLYAGEVTLGSGADGQAPQTGILNITGGQASIGWLRLYPSGDLSWTGGSLRIYSMQFAATSGTGGAIDFGGQSRTVTLDNAFIDLRGSGGFANATGINMVFGPNTLVLLPSTFNPTVFNSFTNQGVTATDDGTLMIPAGRTITIGGNAQPYTSALNFGLQVNGQLIGYLDASDPVLNLAAKVTLPSGGIINLGIGTETFTVLDGVNTVTTASGGQVHLQSGSSITGGTLTAGNVYFDSTTQSSGTINAGVIGEGNSGGYTLTGSGVLKVDSMFDQIGTVTQSGGTQTVTGLIAVDSRYTLSGGTLEAGYGFIGEYSGSAAFTQSGGSFIVDNTLTLGKDTGSYGTYTLNSGPLQMQALVIGDQGKGLFNADGGSVTITGTGNALIVANANPINSPYTTLSVLGATISMPNGTAQIGYQGAAQFNVQSGSFSALNMYLGENGATTAALTGGTLSVSGSLYVGPSMGIHSPAETPDTLAATGGTLNAGAMIVGLAGPAGFTLGAGATVNISGSLLFGQFGTFTAVSGATIHMSGASFENDSTDPTLLTNLGKLALVYTGGAGTADTFEVFSTQAGSPAGIKALTLGSGAAVGNVELVNNTLTGSGHNLADEELIAGSVTVNGGSTLDAGGQNMVVGALTIAGGASPTGTLNLNHALIIANGGAAARDAAFADIGFARNGGLWNKGGISSSSAEAAFAATHFDAATLGVALNSDLPTPYATFAGNTVSANDVLIKYTYGGDADLSGTINGNDYFQIDRGFLDHYTGWVNGDFNYDGVVNGNDYFIIDSNFIDQSGMLAAPEVLAHAAEFGPSYLAGFTPGQLAAIGVPEPGSLALVGVGAISLLARRRRR